MKKIIAATGKHAKTNLSLAYWKARAFRMAGATIGYWVGLEVITAGMNWEEFSKIAFKPLQLFGLILIWIAAGTTAGNSKK